ncbi:hypothetical protein A11Q_1543 [Pseudobdellovibrio exovorus JSS]|uniref:Uncharacterized protein n=1 Tax=Pseudobdellovibrio exovorus JSS TaxID=1184267 RepID=M4VRF1_9BACT|nr:hypothetical protein A11Q_1543 [Pseudobdellovibrio exovorus JSS]
MLVQRKSCYCAFCKVERKVYVNKHLGLMDVLGLVLLGITLTYAIFKGLDPRGLLIVGLLLIVAETFAQTRWRTSMICRNCGFDPVVYVRSPEQAGLKIKAFLDRRSESPEHLLRPPVVLPVKKEVKGQNLSLKI